MGVTTAMTASNWRIQHRYGHHRGIDAPYRSHHAWEVAEYSALGALSYSIRSIWPTFWQPLAESCEKGVLANVKTPINYRWAFVEQGAFIVFVLAIDMSASDGAAIPDTMVRIDLLHFSLCRLSQPLWMR
jgi:hypothetical protein